MKRREFMTMFGAAAAASVVALPLSGLAQPMNRTRRVAILNSSGRGSEGLVTAFRKRLDNLGWHEGRNVEIEVRFGESDINVARVHAAELAAMKPDVFLATNTQMVQLIRASDQNIPIVFVQVPDPIGSGFAASFAHPGRNITGFTNFDPSMGGKWLGLLKDVAPGLKRVCIILQTGNPTAADYLKMITAAAPTYAVQVSPASLRDGDGIDAAVEAFAGEGGGGLVVPPSALTSFFRDRIVALAARHRLPAMYPYSEFATSGGLMSYGFDQKILFEAAASYVDRILKGEKASDLPVQTPTNFELVVNLKTAKALGLTISESFLLLANEVIE